MSRKRISIRRRGIYLIPNLFTTLAMLAGFYAIISSVDHHYIDAALGIFIALMFDSMDGRLARAMNAQSAFGGEYDSLADMLSFGVTPALLVFIWVGNAISLTGWHKFSWLSAFVYLACVALRLARFNSVDVPDHGIAKRYFFGLPCPAAAAMIASMVWLGEIYQIHGAVSAIIVLLVTLCLALLMVSNIYYRSFKDLDINQQTRFIFPVLAMLLAVCIFFRPAHVIFMLTLVYILSGPLAALSRRRRRRHNLKLVK